MPKRIKEFQVEGRTRFPLDMLRYDSCWPTDTTSVNTISASLDTAERREALTKVAGGKLTVSLMTSAVAITPERWQSFGWTVKNAR
jgi:hypothetical protein